MANTTSAQKATRKIEKRTEVNKSRGTRMKTEIRKVEEAIVAGDKKIALAALKVAEPVLARTSQKGVVHKRTASRKVSRLTKRVNAMARSACAARHGRRPDCHRARRKPGSSSGRGWPAIFGVVMARVRRMSRPILGFDSTRSLDPCPGIGAFVFQHSACGEPGSAFSGL